MIMSTSEPARRSAMKRTQAGTALLCSAALLLSAVQVPTTTNAFSVAPSIQRNNVKNPLAILTTRSSSLQAVALEDAATSTSTSTSPMKQQQENEQQQQLQFQLQQEQQQFASWQDDGFIFGLEGSGLERPKGKTAVTVVEGDSLETQPYQVAIVSATFAAHAAILASSYFSMLQHHTGDVASTTLQAVALTVSSWLLADFGSGVLHWSVDNYGNGRTPIMGGIIAAFQGHHSAPWTIAERGFCNNVYKLCTPFGAAPVAIVAALSAFNMIDSVPPAAIFFLSTFCVFEILSQEFHKWSHQLKSETRPVVNWLQKAGLTIARAPHAQHHLAPFEGNYCIISGVCNPWLDESGFFRRLEHAVYKINGVESNAWKLDPELRERTLAGDYSLPPTKQK